MLGERYNVFETFAISAISIAMLLSFLFPRVPTLFLLLNKAISIDKKVYKILDIITIQIKAKKYINYAEFISISGNSGIPR